MRIPLWLLLPALAVAAGCTRQPSVGGEHPLLAEPANLDLGSVPFGEQRSAAWRLSNRSALPLMIQRIGPIGCQCADAELILADGRRLKVRDGLPISVTLAPAESAELRLTVDTARYREPVSRKIGAVPVLFADAEALVLEWRMDVWTPFAVEPWDVDLGEIGVRQRAQGRVLVQGHDDEQFELDANFAEDGWELQSARLSADEQNTLYEIRITAPPELPEGGFQRHFRLLTSLPGAPPVRFSVRGVAGPDLVALPRRVTLDPARGRVEATVELQQRAVGGVVRELEISGLPQGMELAEVDAQPSARRSFKLRWTAAAPAETLRGILVIRTGDAERPELGLPWAVMPRGSESP